MTNLIQLTPFEDETGEIMATAQIWHKEVEIVLNEDDFDELPNLKQINEISRYLEWLNVNQKSVIDFALNAEDFVDNFNDWVEREINKKGKAKLYDGTILNKTVTYDEVYQSILISEVYICYFDDDISLDVDLITEPDYFGGHTFTVEIDSDFSMEFGGVNG